MLSKSPIKSPIQKISTAGTKLVTAASTAVQHGTQLSHAVKTKANNIAEDFAKVDELHRRTSADKKLSPNKRHQYQSKSSTKKSPSRKSPNRNNVGSRGIRDRINMFESSDNIGGGYSPHRTAAAAAAASRSIPEKENDTNSTLSKEGKGYAFTSKDGVKKLSPVLRRKKKVKSPPRSGSKSSEDERREGATSKSPRKRNSPKKKLSPHKRNLYKLGEVDDEEEEEDESTLLGEAINTSIEYDQQPNDIMLSRDERPMLGTRGKSESSTSSSSSSGMKRKSNQLDSINEDKPELNISTSSNKSAEGSAGLLFTTTSQKQTHHRCTTPILDNQIPTKFNSNERDNTKTQSHTLIQSPLRKHMKVVHDSACSGATSCTIKQPFPLLLPNELNSAQKKQLELNELGGGETVVDGSGRSPYLDTLGNVLGTPGMITRSKSDPTADSNTGDSTDDREGREEGKEAALDLLSSAAFLFKTSRRKLI